MTRVAAAELLAVASCSSLVRRVSVSRPRPAARRPLHDLVAAQRRRLAQLAEQLDHAATVVERADQRLGRRVRAVVRPRVAPGLQVVRPRQVPRAQPDSSRSSTSSGGRSSGTAAIAPAKSRSAGALYTGLPPSISSVSTCPARIASTSLTIACTWPGRSPSGSSAVPDRLPDVAQRGFRTCARACTSAGCCSPTMMIPLPRWASRSFAAACMNADGRCRPPGLRDDVHQVGRQGRGLQPRIDQCCHQCASHCLESAFGGDQTVIRHRPGVGVSALDHVQPAHLDRLYRPLAYGPR